MVWIYGGVFFLGVGSELIYDVFVFVVDGDVIVVIFNYRFGLFGFLYLFFIDDIYFGNIGMFDQIVVLCWVKDNIFVFGGDFDNVMVFGELVGGMSIVLFMVMFDVKGLFYKVILESGVFQMMMVDVVKEIIIVFI